MTKKKVSHIYDNDLPFQYGHSLQGLEIKFYRLHKTCSIEAISALYQQAIIGNPEKVVETFSLEASVKPQIKTSTIKDKDIEDLLYQVIPQYIWDESSMNQTDLSSEIYRIIDNTDLS